MGYPPRLIALATAVWLVAGCALLPPHVRPVAETPPISCAPPPVAGPGLGCGQAVAVALALLPDDHPAIEAIDFVYTCTGPDPNAIYDCAVQFSGRVKITFQRPDVAEVDVDVYAGPDRGFVGRIR